ncbi:MAG TPA: glycosyltransferase family 9 protein [Terrimicrobiaceae bacterium]|nr:glycosyltransferase family 9 protein [Terrimicrobiaceae bacterium]
MDHLLIIKPGSFGDIIHALPCASAVRRAFPKTKITWLVDERWEPLLRNNPSVDETAVFPRQRFRGMAGKLRSLPWAFGLQRLRPDTALDLQGLLRSGLMARLSGARRIIGLSDAREGARLFHQERVPVGETEHAVRRYLRSLAAFGLDPGGRVEFALPEGTLPARLAGIPPFILLHPYARGSGKSLSESQVIALCRLLAPHPVVLAGTGEIRESLPGNAINLLNGTSIGEMVGAIRAARFVVSVDSGPMHIAAAVNPRLLSIHTWSDPRLVGPYCEDAWIWQAGKIQRQELAGTTAGKGRQPQDRDIQEMADFVKQTIAAPTAGHEPPQRESAENGD